MRAGIANITALESRMNRGGEEWVQMTNLIFSLNFSLLGLYNGRYDFPTKHNFNL